MMAFIDTTSHDEQGPKKIVMTAVRTVGFFALSGVSLYCAVQHARNGKREMDRL